LNFFAVQLHIPGGGGPHESAQRAGRQRHRAYQVIFMQH